MSDPHMVKLMFQFFPDGVYLGHRLLVQPDMGGKGGIIMPNRPKMHIVNIHHARHQRNLLRYLIYVKPRRT